MTFLWTNQGFANCDTFQNEWHCAPLCTNLSVTPEPHRSRRRHCNNTSHSPSAVMLFSNTLRECSCTCTAGLNSLYNMQQLPSCSNNLSHPISALIRRMQQAPMHFLQHTFPPVVLVRSHHFSDDLLVARASGEIDFHHMSPFLCPPTDSIIVPFCYHICDQSKSRDWRTLSYHNKALS